MEGLDGVEELYGRLLPVVERMAAQHMRYEVSLRDDLVQEVMVALMAVDFNGLEHPKAYLATVVRRVALRLVSRHPRFDLLLEDCEDRRDDLSVLEERELLGKLSELIDQLSTRCRKLLDLCRFKEERDDVMAVELDVPVKNIPPHRYQCLKRLRAQLEEDHPELHAHLMESLGAR